MQTTSTTCWSVSIRSCGPFSLRHAGGFALVRLMERLSSAPRRKARIKNTDALIQAVHNNRIDVITHPGYRIPSKHGSWRRRARQRERPSKSTPVMSTLPSSTSRLPPMKGHPLSSAAMPIAPTGSAISPGAWPWRRRRVSPPGRFKRNTAADTLLPWARDLLVLGLSVGVHSLLKGEPYVPDMRFVIITGLSGAGKSTAMRVLEDVGFFCVDNLPPALIPKFAELCVQTEGRITKVAVVCDIRSGGFFDSLFGALAELERSGFGYEILFLEATDECLSVGIRNRAADIRWAAMPGLWRRLRLNVKGCPNSAALRVTSSIHPI